MNNSNIKENTPNAEKLINSLRNTGYNNISAIADLADNSIDAGAQNIWISIEPIVGDFRITLADDGSGMSERILDEAMRLGSDTERNENSDLGKFGMGLVTASISIAKRLTVITGNENGFYTSVQDLDQIASEGKFVKELRPSTEDEKALFGRLTNKSSHGTVLILEKCDRIQDKNINELCKRLSIQLGQIFRKFINNDTRESYSRNIFVRGTKIGIIDPLWLNDPSTEEFSDSEFEVKIGDYSENVRVKMVALPDFDKATNVRHGINQKNQGFYVMRNNREIASGEDLGVFTKHNDLNRLRMEIYFSANLDNVMGVNFTKRDIKPTQEIVDKIKNIVSAQIVSFKKRVVKAKAVENAEGVNHTPAAQTITSKSNILINPKEKYTPRTRTGEHPGTRIPTGEGSPKTGEGAEKGPMSKMNCEFLLRTNGPSGNLYEAEQVGKKVIIYYNVDHPFYQEFISANKDNKDIINTIDFLIYSLASAQLINQNLDNVDLFDNFNAIFSSNLRTLIN